MSELGYFRCGKRRIRVEIIDRYPEQHAVRIVRAKEDWVVKESEVVTDEEDAANRFRGEAMQCSVRWAKVIEMVKEERRYTLAEIGEAINLNPGGVHTVIEKCKRLGLL